MICKVNKTIEKYSLFENVKSVAVGVSGGADSMCLLDILSSLKDKYGIILKAVHLNHNLRGEEALRDENLVREYCRKKDIELLVFSEDIRLKAHEMSVGEEECGRIIRYRCYEKAECDAVATAHTLSDSIETILFNLLRGTGSKGLCGIPEKRQPNIIRPLIECTREEIENYCHVHSVPFVTDSTNLTDDYKRNFIRHNIVPLFSKINPSFEESISRTVDILKEEYDCIETGARELLKSSTAENGYLTDKFSNAHSAVSKRALSILLGEKMNKPTESRHIDLTYEAVIKGTGKIRISDSLFFQVKDGLITFTGETKQTEAWEYEFKKHTAPTPYGVFRLTEERGDVRSTFDADKIRGALTVGSRRESDSFTFKNRKVSKSLKKLFNEMKIPVSQRNKIAVIRDSEGVIWVEGIGVNAKYLPDEKTERFYCIKKEG